MKPQLFWAVVRPCGAFVLHTITYHRIDSIAALCRRDTWRKWKKLGYRVAKVEVREARLGKWR